MPRILAELRQTPRTLTDYSIEFCTLAAECSWNAEAQWDMFLYGLGPHIQNKIYALDLPTSLDELIDLAIRVDARLWQQNQHRPLLSTTDLLDRSTYNRLTKSWIPSQCKWDGLVSLRMRRREMPKPWIMFILRGGWSYCCTVSGKSRSPPVSRRLLAGGFAMGKTSRTFTHLPIKIQCDSDIYSCQALIAFSCTTVFFLLISTLRCQDCGRDRFPIEFIVHKHLIIPL